MPFEFDSHMLQNRYHLPLKVPAQFSPRFPSNPPPIAEYEITWIDKSLHDWLLIYDFVISHAEVFFRHPEDNDSGPIHVDGNNFDDHVKINYVYSEKPSLMNWYLPKKGQPPESRKTEIGTDYLFSKPENCSLIFSAQIGQPSLINSGLLHNISPVLSPRFCFSFVLANVKTTTLISWDEAVKAFGLFAIDNSSPNK